MYHNLRKSRTGKFTLRLKKAYRQYNLGDYAVEFEALLARLVGRRVLFRESNAIDGPNEATLRASIPLQRQEDIRRHVERKLNRHKGDVFPSGQSEYIGVAWDRKRNRWKAQLTERYTNYFLGRFESRHDAGHAYNLAVSILRDQDGPNDIPADAITPQRRAEIERAVHERLRD